MNKKEKPYNNGTWTTARFNSFIKGGLRQMSLRWSPIHTIKKKARVKRGYYLCAECGQVVPASFRDKDGKRKSNVHVDHIQPVIDVKKGFESWDKVIERLFVEEDKLQVLCHNCHMQKCAEEASERREAKKQHKKEG